MEEMQKKNDKKNDKKYKKPMKKQIEIIVQKKKVVSSLVKLNRELYYDFKIINSQVRN